MLATPPQEWSTTSKLAQKAIQRSDSMHSRMAQMVLRAKQHAVRRKRRGSMQLVTTRGPGSVVGELCIDGKPAPSPSTVVAKGPVTLLVIKNEKVRRGGSRAGEVREVGMAECAAHEKGCAFHELAVFTCLACRRACKHPTHHTRMHTHPTLCPQVTKYRNQPSVMAALHRSQNASLVQEAMERFVECEQEVVAVEVIRRCGDDTEGPGTGVGVGMGGGVVLRQGKGREAAIRVGVGTLCVPALQLGYPTTVVRPRCTGGVRE